MTTKIEAMPHGHKPPPTHHVARYLHLCVFPSVALAEEDIFVCQEVNKRGYFTAKRRAKVQGKNTTI